MKGDFTRNTFDPARQFTRVLMQQGRVQLDADWNEQGAILLHYLQALAADLIGPHAGPQANVGFQMTPVERSGTIVDLQIGNGRYYVDGRLCENPARYDEEGNVIPVTYYGQANYPLNEDDNPLPDLPFLVYLDVWERLITAVQDDTIREVALGGADTAVRAQLVWQVKVSGEMPDGPTNDEDWRNFTQRWQAANRGLLKARAGQGGGQPDDACITPPDARYRGAENQLYRVEVHHGGLDANGRPQRPSCKWSRDNGSVVFPIRSLSGKVATVEGLGRDGRSGLQPGDWVEVLDDGLALRDQPGPLLTVQAVDHLTMAVTLSEAPGITYDGESSTHPLLRRWDGYMAEIPEERWLRLEDGIEIQFQPGPNETPHSYRSGDYWLVPARTATGDVEWPGPVDDPDSLPPHGVTHHYAPLATVSVTGDVTDLRRQFKALWQL
ncbi:MAG TPA: DUF6519 domain-containing protein [Chloroflexota bacterium]|nr:DUF6519 domain-containing protein [Chloroflexota bacterium]HUM71356.1 DUF6519 domain-containing protein [Chloroflexota bacterium]